MKLVITPEQELKYARESFSSALSQGLTHASDFASRLKDALPSIMRGLAPAKEAVTLPEITGINKEQIKFLKILRDVPFSELREIKAQTPEGVFVSYLDFLQTLLPVTEYLKDIESKVIRPYVYLLATVVSDAKGAVSTNNHRSVYQDMEKFREESYKQFAKLYGKNSVETDVHVKNVVSRNSDWNEVLPLVNQCVANMQMIDRESIKQQIQQCSDYLDILYGYLKEKKMETASLEAAQALSDGAWQVAQELQFMSTTYYRVLALNSAVWATMCNIDEAMG